MQGESTAPRKPAHAAVGQPQHAREAPCSQATTMQWQPNGTKATRHKHAPAHHRESLGAREPLPCTQLQLVLTGWIGPDCGSSRATPTLPVSPTTPCAACQVCQRGSTQLQSLRSSSLKATVSPPCVLCMASQGCSRCMLLRCPVSSCRQKRAGRTPQRHACQVRQK